MTKTETKKDKGKFIWKPGDIVIIKPAPKKKEQSKSKAISTPDPKERKKDQ